MHKPVGFDQKIELKHLDITIKEARVSDRKDMYGKLEEYLKQDIKGDKSRKNAITMLMKIWYLVDKEQESIKEQAYELYPIIEEEQRLILHWGMTLLAYPFFKDVIEEMGNLFRLQNEVSSQQLGRRIKMLYGDRRRVEVATSAVLMSLKTWGIIERGKNQVYTLNKKTALEEVKLKNWLLKVLLSVSEYKTMPLTMISNLNLLFPFDLKLNINEIDTTEIKIDRQGLDTYMLSL